MIVHGLMILFNFRPPIHESMTFPQPRQRRCRLPGRQFAAWSPAIGITWKCTLSEPPTPQVQRLRIWQSRSKIWLIYPLVASFIHHGWSNPEKPSRMAPPRNSELGPYPPASLGRPAAVMSCGGYVRRRLWSWLPLRQCTQCLSSDVQNSTEKKWQRLHASWSHVTLPSTKSYQRRKATRSLLLRWCLSLNGRSL